MAQKSRAMVRRSFPSAISGTVRRGSARPTKQTSRLSRRRARGGLASRPAVSVRMRRAHPAQPCRQGRSELASNSPSGWTCHAAPVDLADQGLPGPFLCSSGPDRLGASHWDRSSGPLPLTEDIKRPSNSALFRSNSAGRLSALFATCCVGIDAKADRPLREVRRVHLTTGIGARSGSSRKADLLSRKSSADKLALSSSTNFGPPVVHKAFMHVLLVLKTPSPFLLTPDIRQDRARAEQLPSRRLHELRLGVRFSSSIL